jgi:hypothetical protein
MDNISEMIRINADLEPNGTTGRGGHRPRPSDIVTAQAA